MGLNCICISFFRLPPLHMFDFTDWPFFLFFNLNPQPISCSLRWEWGVERIPFLSYKTTALLWWVSVMSLSSVKNKNMKWTFPLAEYRPQRDWHLSLRHCEDTLTSRDTECLVQHCRSNYRIFTSLAYFGRAGPQHRSVQTNKASAS